MARRSFPLVVWQTGSGTQSNMNMNEVLANRASEILGGERGEGAARPSERRREPRPDQSNDVFPTAMHVAAVVAMRDRLLPAAATCCAPRSTRRPRPSRDIVKIGRTHLQDATPLTLGQEFSGYVAQLDHAQRHIEDSLDAPRRSSRSAARRWAPGSTRIPEFGERVAAELSRLTGCAFVTRAQQVRGARHPRRDGATRTAR